MKIRPTNLKGFVLFSELITKTEILKEKLQFALIIPITELNKTVSITSTFKTAYEYMGLNVHLIIMTHMPSVAHQLVMHVHKSNF